MVVIAFIVVPPSIAATTEFSSLCPDTADCRWRDLTNCGPRRAIRERLELAVMSISVEQAQIRGRSRESAR